MTDLLYKNVFNRWQEVNDLPVQNLGPFTSLYRAIVSRLKVMPWPAILAIALLFVFGIILILGTSIVHLVTILQRGF